MRYKTFGIEKRRGYTVRVGVLTEGEIDFVAERRDERLYIQVAYLLAEESTVERDTASPYPGFPDLGALLLLSLHRHSTGGLLCI